MTLGGGFVGDISLCWRNGAPLYQYPCGDVNELSVVNMYREWLKVDRSSVVRDKNKAISSCVPIAILRVFLPLFQSTTTFLAPPSLCPHPATSSEHASDCLPQASAKLLDTPSR
jgi:hypothetical protein